MYLSSAEHFPFPPSLLLLSPFLLLFLTVLSNPLVCGDLSSISRFLFSSFFILPFEFWW